MTGTDQGGSALRPDNTPGIRCSPSRPPVLHTASGTASLATRAVTQAARHRARRCAGLCCGWDSRQRPYRRLRVGEFRWSASALLPNRLELCAAVDTSVNYDAHLDARPLNQNSNQRPQSVRLSQYRDTVPELAVAARPGVASPRVHTCRKTPPQGVVRHHAMARTVRAARRLRPPSPRPDQTQCRDRYRRHHLVRKSFPAGRAHLCSAPLRDRGARQRTHAQSGSGGTSTA
jgi:hypothetical protein